MGYLINIPYKDAGNFQVTGSGDFTGNALQLGKVNRLFSETIDLSALDDGVNVEYKNGFLQSVNDYGANNVLAAKWESVGTLNFSEGPTISYTPTISGGWPVAGNHNFIYGIPTSDKYNFSFQKKFGAVGAGFTSQYIVTFNSTNKIQIGNDGANQIAVRIQSDLGGTETFSFACPYLSNTDREISVDFTNKVGAINGAIDVYLDGVYLGSSVLTNAINTSVFSNIQLVSGQVTRHHLIHTDIVHSKQDYTVPSFENYPFSQKNIQALNKEYIYVGALQAFDALSDTDNSNAKYILDGKYWNGSAWVVSDGTFNQANTAADITTNAGDFVYSGDYVVINIVFNGGIATRPKISSLSYNYTGQDWYETISATSTASLPADSFNSVSFVYNTPDANCGVRLAILIGSNLYYYDASLQGGKGAWTNADGTFDQANTPDELTDEVMQKLNIKGLFKPVVFIQSLNDPITGLKNINSPYIVYLTIDFNYTLPSFAEPNKVLIYGLDRDTCAMPTENIGDGTKVGDVVYSFVVRNPKAIKHTGTVIRKGDCKSVALGSAKVIADGIFETETLRDTPNPGDVYKYEYLLVKTTTIDNRGSIAYKVEEDSLGYAEAPNQTEALITDLDLSDEPGTNF